MLVKVPAEHGKQRGPSPGFLKVPAEQLAALGVTHELEPVEVVVVPLGQDRQEELDTLLKDGLNVLSGQGF